MLPDIELGKVLIVDDTPDNIDILNDVLVKYTRMVAINGEKALEIASSGTPPDIILLDIMMPGIDGFEVCRRLKSEDKTKNIPVIFMTSLSDVDDKVKGFGTGAVDYITKPIQPDEVLARVETHLKISSLQRELLYINNYLEEKVEERTIDLKNAKEKAEESSRLKSHFLRLMSHELRTPMNGILGYAEILREEISNPEQKEFAAGIYESGTRLKETLNSILILSKLESSKHNLQLKPDHLNKRIEALIASLVSSAKLKNLTLKMIAHNPNIYANIEQTMFEIIVNNLVVNAIKYTNSGSITLDLGVEDETVIIKVIDTGIGIPDEKLDVIFEEFRQVDEGLSRNFDGVGLGLSIVRKYVEKLNGEISVQSKLEEGSVFTVKLPVAEKVEAQIASPKPIPEKEAAAIEEDEEKFILYVEDDLTNLNVAKMFLKNMCTIDAVRNGEEAIEMAKQKRYKTILMDVNLGTGLSGVETTQQLRFIEDYYETPIVALTAYAMDGDAEDFLKRGFTHYLAKPFTKKELCELVGDVLKS